MNYVHAISFTATITAMARTSIIALTRTLNMQQTDNNNLQTGVFSFVRDSAVNRKSLFFFFDPLHFRNFLFLF